MRVFLDASALVPLVHQRDQWHPAVVRQLRALTAAGPVEFCTANWTFYEALAVVKRAGHHRCLELAGFVARSVAVLPVEPDVENEAFERFLQWHDKTASVVDHANLLTAIAHRCGAILTYDSD
ncbi:MAG TPA: PIN domain-containing protein, partial [Tepidiformaceae bacterium]|nr:PIN domain-containing protein [Tepidiformaceae bacterium]